MPTAADEKPTSVDVDGDNLRDGEDEEDEEEEGLSGSAGEDDEEDEEMSESGEEDAKAQSGGGAAGSGSGAGAKATGSGGADAKGSGSGSGSAAERSLRNQPFDVALDLSESESSNVSEHGHDSPKKSGMSLKNMPFDEELELSMTQEMESPARKPQPDEAKASGEVAVPAATATATTTAAATTKLVSSISVPSSGKEGAGMSGGEVKNRPFDEEMDLSDSGESVDTNESHSPDNKTLKAKAATATTTATSAAAPSSQPSTMAAARDKEPPTRIVATSTPTPAPKKEEKLVMQEERKPAPAQTAAAAKPTPTPAKQPETKATASAAIKKKEESEESAEDSGSEEEEEESEEEEEEEAQEDSPSRESAGAANNSGGNAMSAVSASNQAAMLANAGTYKESDFASLKVGKDVKELFQYIGRFKPQDIELETKLKCFIPEYIPAVGEMDAFLKPSRPDGEPDFLALKSLDEPSLSQSDATVLDLQLRSTSKTKHGDLIVRSLENAEKTPKEIDKWIRSIADLHRTKPPPQVHYTKPMPDIESLMQVWPDEVEDVLTKLVLPSATIDVTLEQYVRVICAILDIPVHKNVYESLHVLFTLYLEFRSNQHFMNYDEPHGTGVGAEPLLGEGGQQEVDVAAGSSARRDEEEFARMNENTPLRK